RVIFWFISNACVANKLILKNKPLRSQMVAEDLVMEGVEVEIPAEEGEEEGKILKQLNATSATNLDTIKVLAQIGEIVSTILNLIRKRNFF
ncbi:hypothetical protein L195_g060119, partial [Trifolium pratense]